MKRILGIDYGSSKVGLAITDPLGITAQGLETVMHKGNDKILLKKLDEIMENYEISTIVVGMPYHMNGTKSERAEITEKFLHKLKCKYNHIKLETMDERLTTVAANKTLNFLQVDKHKKKEIEDTLAAVYILEMYMNKVKLWYWFLHSQDSCLTVVDSWLFYKNVLQKEYEQKMKNIQKMLAKK